MVFLRCCISGSSEKNNRNLWSKKQYKNCGTKEVAGVVGKLLAEKAVKKGITNVVFDRGGYVYHGRVKTLAEAARESGLKF